MNSEHKKSNNFSEPNEIYARKNLTSKHDFIKPLKNKKGRFNSTGYSDTPNHIENAIEKSSSRKNYHNMENVIEKSNSHKNIQKKNSDIFKMDKNIYENKSRITSIIDSQIFDNNSNGSHRNKKNSIYSKESTIYGSPREKEIQNSRTKPENFVKVPKTNTKQTYQNMNNGYIENSQGINQGYLSDTNNQNYPNNSFQNMNTHYNMYNPN